MRAYSLLNDHYVHLELSVEILQFCRLIVRLIVLVTYKGSPERGK